jgi:hypothetical protein
MIRRCLAVTFPNLRSIVSQVVMPLDGFIASVAFLHTAVAGLVDRGILTKGHIDSIYF